MADCIRYVTQKLHPLRPMIQNTGKSYRTVGRLGYDSGEGTLVLGLEGGNVTLKVGSDLYQYVYNNTYNTTLK